ncbi:MAG: hypothetical protein VB957_17050 [Pseudomonadales bacterium]
MKEETQAQAEEPVKQAKSIALRITTWLLALACFYLVYTRVEQTAARDGLSAYQYVVNFFQGVDWLLWLGLMIPYSIVFFLIDAHATWRVIKWFNNSQIKFTNILPIRASAYILSLLNEYVGKGAMSLYLLRRHNVPVWKAASSMILLGIVEIYQLLMFSAVGVFFYYDLVLEASTQLPLTTILKSVYIVAFLYFPFHILYFNGAILKNSKLRDRQIFNALRQAKLIDYFLILLCKAPNLIGAVLVYTLALELFSVDVGFGQMLAFLPVIFIAAAMPLPFHAGALLLWVVLFPEFPEVGVFSLVMHTFFVSFNAVIGLIFLPRANKELFVEGSI